MKHLRRFISGFLGMGLALAMSGAPVATAAGGTVLYVNDTTANDPSPTFCPATGLTSLQAAKTALGTTTSNITIYVCQGFYLGTANKVVFDGFSNLKIVAKGTAGMYASGLAEPFIWVKNSSKVTVSGLLFTANGDLGATRATAIQYDFSSGVISKNLILSWHEDFGSSMTTNHVGIMVYGDAVTQVVTVDRNSILDVQSYGIEVVGPAKAKITRNKITFHVLNLPSAAPPAPAIQTGILLVEAGPGVSVSGNLIESDSGIEPMCGSSCLIIDNDSAGITLLQTSGASIKGNTVRYTQYGVSVLSWCLDQSGLPGLMPANGNIISGNKLFENGAGVRINAINYFGTGCTAQANGNKVQSNTFTHEMYGLDRVLVKAALPATAAGNIVTKNKFYGFPTLATAISSVGDGVSGLVNTPNTLFALPPTGAP